MPNNKPAQPATHRGRFSDPDAKIVVAVIGIIAAIIAALGLLGSAAVDAGFIFSSSAPDSREILLSARNLTLQQVEVLAGAYKFEMEAGQQILFTVEKPESSSIQFRWMNDTPGVGHFEQLPALGKTIIFFAPDESYFEDHATIETVRSILTVCEVTKDGLCLDDGYTHRFFIETSLKNQTPDAQTSLEE